MSKESIFKFKQFQLTQYESHLKVTTEATIFGSWIDTTNKRHILDIGSGTGLLSLMIAQRSDAKIKAIEIQEEMAHLSQRNFEQSPWASHLSVEHFAIQHFKPNHRFDLIVCNPPFFFAQSPRKSEEKNRAMHNNDLSLEDLLMAVDKLMEQEGSFYVLFPPEMMEQFSRLASAKSLFRTQKLEIIHAPGKAVLREAACFERNAPSDFTSNQLVIRNPDGTYSKAYEDLMEPYLIVF